MQFFEYRNGQLCAEQVPLSEVADRYGTPCYVYSRASMESQWKAYDEAFGERSHLICYAVKANSNIAILDLLSRLGSGFDIVSAGELERVLRAGGDPGKIIFSGVGKQTHEMMRCLEAGIRCFNVESEQELIRLNKVAGDIGKPARVSIRINPDIDAATHPYIATGLSRNKFGISVQDAIRVYKLAHSLPFIEITGIDCHIGSQITADTPHVDAVRRLLLLVDELEAVGISIQHIDIGGGLGIKYRDEAPPDAATLVKNICDVITDKGKEIIVEPGRSIVGQAGVLLTRVEYLKDNSGKSFAVMDAAMNDLLRPALYGAWQEVLPVNEHSGSPARVYDLVGPVCESGDFLALDRELSIEQGDLLVVCAAGAYSFCMSSNYNSRPRVAEVMVDSDRTLEIRRRETIDELMTGESTLPG